LEYIREGDTLIIHSLDRLARNVDDLRRIVRELNERGVSVEFVKNCLTFSGGAEPTARLMLTMLGAFAEFERELIRERQREGIAIAKAKGADKGRRKAWGLDDARELVEQAHGEFRRLIWRGPMASVGKPSTSICGTHVCQMH